MEDIPVSQPGIHIQCSLVSKVSLAQWQNHHTVCQELCIISAEATAAHSNLQLRLKSEPEALLGAEWQLDTLPPGRSVSVEVGRVEMNPAFLARLTEATRVRVEVTLVQNGTHELARTVVDTEALAANQWGGTSSSPELLAAFVQPNDAAVQQLVKDAAILLEEGGDRIQLTGYKAGPEAVWRMTEAGWRAVAARGLSYALPAPGFEREGQKIRTCQQVLQSGLATCLDTTVLLASVLEAMGLQPVTLLIDGHAFLGLGLVPNQFEAMLTEDLARVRNRVFSPRHLMVIETTVITGAKPASLGEAVRLAEATLQQLEPDRFLAAIDIAAARTRRIRPLTDASPDAATERYPAAPREADATAAPSWLATLGAGSQATPTDPMAKPTTREQRLTGWKNELLDLTLGNALLNLKEGKKVLALVVPEVGALEDALAEGKRFKIQALPKVTPAGKHTLSPEEVTTLEHEAAREGLRKGVLYARGSEAALDAQLTELYRRERLLQQEGDADALFLTIGSLRWRHEQEKVSHIAPLVLLPLALERSSVSAPFYLRGKDVDDARLNPTLLEKLRRDFRLSLPFAYDELPRDAAGLHIDAILDAVGTAVRAQPGFEVLRDCRVSLLSFTRYLLWRDLENDPAILGRNAVVEHLLERPMEPLAGQGELPLAAQLDDELSPEAMATPFPSDSSQLVAVQAALRGRNLVIIGPPGTGKSQTIANIIAQSLAAKKRILFVSAKAEALDVVYSRLKEKGLGELCLSMHRHDNGGKADVIEQLRTAWAVAPPPNDQHWQLEVDRYARSREQLNGYARALHEKGSHGLSPYEAMTILARYQSSPRVPLRWPTTDAHDAHARARLTGLAQQLGLAAKEAAGLANSLVSHVTRRTFTPLWQSELVHAAAEANEAARALLAAWAPLRARHTPLLPSPRAADLPMFAEAARAALALPSALCAIVDGPALPAFIDAADMAIARVEAWQAAQEKTPAPWEAQMTEGWGQALDHVVALRETEAALAPNYPGMQMLRPTDGTQSLVAASAIAPPAAAELLRTWQASHTQWWPRSWWNRRRVQARMSAYRGGPVQRGAVLAELMQLARWQDLTTRVEAYVPPAPARELWRGPNTDVASARPVIALQTALAGRPVPDEDLALIEQGACGQWAAEALGALRNRAAREAALSELTQSPHAQALPSNLWAGPVTPLEPLRAARAAAIALVRATQAIPSSVCAAPAALLSSWTAALRASPDAEAARRELQQWVDGLPSWLIAIAAFEERLAEPAGAAGGPPTALDLATIAACAAACPTWRNQLRAWCTWLRMCHEAREAALTPLVEALEQGVLRDDQVEACFLASYAAWWLDRIVTERSALNSFTPSFHQQAITDFSAADDYLSGRAAGRLRHFVTRELPKRELVAAKSEWGRLNHELNKKKRFMPLRKIFESSRDAMLQLTPCFLMSPLSVAQFLPMEADLFDMVIFDEASQIRCSEAVGAMARSKQVVMVGDPKQMPPTNFFSRVSAAEDDEFDDDAAQTQATQPLESILDLCRAARLPQHTLRWHYRSRHEDLIAFSNAHYYGNELVTFCSPDAKRRAISFHHVPEGSWATGRARHNLPEARALVADLVGHIRDGSYLTDKRQVGIIAFNLSQARLIEDLLDQEGRNDPQVALAIAPDGPLKLFVKNLESVQGDERDVIYFSIAYAASVPGGEIAYRFGPLNVDGGERRLNVAITRARVGMKVFCSFHSAALRNEKLKARGAIDLKKFLAYAEHGPDAHSIVSAVSVGSYDSDFEEKVADALRALGWSIDTQIGVSSFRIDLGVLDPNAPGRFLAGIECDGATYHSAATARDRDKVRQSVLENLGWKIFRLWSTDYWHDPDAAIVRLDAQLRALVKSHNEVGAPHSQEVEPPTTLSPDMLAQTAQTLLNRTVRR